MPRVTRIDADTAGGEFVESASTFFVGGKLVIVKGNHIASHGDNPHNNAYMLGSSSTFFVEGIPICREGDLASCGHPATGSIDFWIGN